MGLRKKEKVKKKVLQQLENQKAKNPPDNRIFQKDLGTQYDTKTKPIDTETKISPENNNSKKKKEEKIIVNETTVIQAYNRLNRYKQFKSRLEKRLIANEDYWKLRQWDYYSEKNRTNKIATAWLWNCIASKHADMMDGYPEANIRARKAEDVEEAEKLKSIIPVIMAQNDYENTYSDLCNYILKQGVCCAGVFWDGKKHDGLGDVRIEKINMLELYWESGVTDIQDSREVFHVKTVDVEALCSQYRELEGKINTSKISQAKYHTDDDIDESGKTTVIDWYYKKIDEQGNQVLHYCKFTNGTVLFASENEPDKYPNGWFDHGMYPFVTQSLFPIEGTIAGYGYIDIGRGDQEAIDTLTSAILTNAKVTAKPRYFVQQGNSGVNEAEFANFENDFVHVIGSIDESNVRQITTNSISSNVIEMREQFIEELKETLGNRDVNNGGSSSGVTAASAIAAMQEQSGKISRVHNKLMYTMHVKITNMIIELIRQFYTIPREYRITGKMGKDEYVNYDNQGLIPQQQPNIMGIEMGLRLPVFDIEVTAQKSSPYSKMEQNELAIQLYNLGVFNPNNTDMALALLKTMDFAHKDDIMQLVSNNGTLLQKYQSLQKIALQLAQGVDANYGTNMTQQLYQAITAESNNNSSDGLNSSAVTSLNTSSEHPYVDKAREQAQNSTQVRE